MSFEPDAIVDRRRLRRNLSLWRIAALVAVVGALMLLAYGMDESVPFGRDHIAQLEVYGIITEDEDRDEAILDLAENDSAKALIVRIDSPGGTTSGSEGLYLALRQVASKKPVVAVMSTVAASGGFIAAIGADYIFARGNTITGSIGVLMQSPDASKLMEKIGLEVETVASGPLKGKPSPFEPLDEQTRQSIQEMIQDSYRWFVGLVAERRNLAPERALALADGRVFTGRMALDVRLIDQIGGQREAIDWLETEKGLAKELPVQVLEYGDEDSLSGGLVNSMIFSLFGKSLDVKRLTLDGMVSLWHP